MMRRALTAALCGAALIATPAVALAEAPQPTTIDVAKACGTVTLTFTGPDDGLSGTHGFRWNAVNGNVATDAGVRTGTVVVDDDEVEKLNIEFPEDEFGGTAAVTVAVFFGPNSHLQPRLDIYPVDTDCKDPAETTTPTTTPAATTTPAETTAPDEAMADEFDCADFPLPDGRTAQDILDADPADPNRLDLDGDGQACDLDDTDPATDGGDFDQVGTPPAGGVATGG